MQVSDLVKPETASKQTKETQFSILKVVEHHDEVFALSVRGNEEPWGGFHGMKGIL